MFPRDQEAVEMIHDGRWKRPPNLVSWTIRSRMAAPLALRRDAERNLTAVLMVPAADCFAISMPHDADAHRAIYFSLFGRDLKSGESASAGARLVIRHGVSDEQAVELYRQFAGKEAGRAAGKEH